jgi:hypothetical protein
MMVPNEIGREARVHESSCLTTRSLQKENRVFPTVPRFGDIPQEIILIDSHDVDNQSSTSSTCSLSYHEIGNKKPSSRFDHHMKALCPLPIGRPLACPPLLQSHQIKTPYQMKCQKRKFVSVYPPGVEFGYQTFTHEDILSLTATSMSSKRRVSNSSNDDCSTILESKESTTTRLTASESSLLATKNVDSSTMDEFRNINLLTFVASYVNDYAM